MIVGRTVMPVWLYFPAGSNSYAVGFFKNGEWRPQSVHRTAAEAKNLVERLTDWPRAIEFGKCVGCGRGRELTRQHICYVCYVKGELHRSYIDALQYAYTHYWPIGTTNRAPRRGEVIGGGV